MLARKPGATLMHSPDFTEPHQQTVRRPRFPLHHPVLFRRHPGAHQERGTIVSLTYGRQPVKYEVITGGERVIDPVDVEADEEGLAAIRELELGGDTG